MSRRAVAVVALLVLVNVAAVLLLAVQLRGEPDPLADIPDCPEVWWVAAHAPCITDPMPGDGYSYLIRRDSKVIELEGDR